MDTLKFIIKRIFYLLILLLGVATIVFVLTRLVPTDPVAANLSQRNLNNEEMVNAFRAKWGLDKPVWQQYLIYSFAGKRRCVKNICGKPRSDSGGISKEIVSCAYIYGGIKIVCTPSVKH